MDSCIGILITLNFTFLRLYETKIYWMNYKFNFLSFGYLTEY